MLVNCRMLFAGAALVSNLLGCAAADSTVYEYNCNQPTPTTIRSTVTPTAARSISSVNVVVSTATSSYAAHETVLVPAIHWDHDLNDIQNLKPQDSAALYYAEASGQHDPSISSQYAHMISNFTYPTVVLDHSAFIQSVSYSISLANASIHELLISFNAFTAYDFAKSQWATATNLVLVSSSTDASGQHTYYLVSSIVWSDKGMVCLCYATVLVLQQSITDIQISWGTHTPSINSTAGLSSGAGNTNGVNGNSGSNSTSSGVPLSRNGTCGAPSSSVIDGFPAAACGDNFDQILDDAIGYLDFSQQDFSSSLQEFIPGLGDYNSDDYDVDTGLTRRSSQLDKRGRFKISLRSIYRAVVSPVVNYVKQKAQQVAVAVKVAVVTAAKAVVNVVVDVVKTPFNPKFDKILNVNLGPKNLVASPFGQAAKIGSFNKATKDGSAAAALDIYCVDCGFKARLDLRGQATLNVIDGMTAGFVTLQGNAHAGLFVGVDAQASYDQKFKQPIADAGLPGFSIPKIITIGPVVTLAAELDVAIKAQGQLLVGVAMDLPDFDARLDLVDSSKSYSRGFTPVFTKKFEAKGEIDLTIGLGLPLSVGVGLVAPIIKLDKTIALIEKPGIRTTARYVGATDSTALAGESCPNGISYDLSLTNDVSLNFFGLKNIDLFPYKSPPLAAGCFLLGSRSSSSSSSSTTTTATTVSSTSTTSASTTDTTSATETSSSSSMTTTDATTTTGTTSAASATSTDSEIDTESHSSTTTNAATTTSSTSVSTTSDLTTSSTSASTTADPTSSDVSTTSTETTSADPTATVEPIKRSLVPRQDDPNNPDDADYQALAAMASKEANEDAADTAPSAQDEGFSYITIADIKRQYQLSASPDGNFYLDAFGSVDGSLFQTNANVTVADDQDRIFHYYTDTMTKYGVSRFRLSALDSVPRTANIANLSPLDYDPETSEDTNVFVVVDLVGGFFFPVLCTIDGQYSKLFLVNDIEAGMKTLVKEELRYTVTGGVVTECDYMPFIGVPFV